MVMTGASTDSAEAARRRRSASGIAARNRRSARSPGVPWRSSASAIASMASSGSSIAGGSGSGSKPSTAAVTRMPLPFSPRWLEMMMALSPSSPRTSRIASGIDSALKHFMRIEPDPSG